jgi:hypothetical protein
MKRIITTMAAISLLTLGAASVRADVTPFLNSVTGSAGNWTWTYHSELSAAQQLDSVGATPGAVSGKMGVKSDGYKDYFTIYDFAGFIPGTNFQPVNWLFQSLNVGTTPGSVIPGDNPNLPNLTWIYNGPEVTGPVETANGLGLFGAKSIYGERTISYFAADATKHDPVNTAIDGYTQQNVGSMSVPISSVPEPSTFILLGAGLMGAVALKRRTKKGELGPTLSL